MADVEPSLAELLRATVAWLLEHRGRDEALGRLERKRGLFGLGGGVVLRPAGRVWRLGVLLLDAEGRLYEAAVATRAVEPRHPNYQSVSGEHRRNLRRLALQGGFPEGESVNLDADELALDEDSLRAGSGPLLLDGDRLLVRWAPGRSHVPLRPYLEERARLLTQRDGWDEGETAG
ncbi:MAG TPA: hypothetical protein VIL55_09535 [Naasia sp.]|jgi:hypothetical protein